MRAAIGLAVGLATAAVAACGSSPDAPGTSVFAGGNQIAGTIVRVLDGTPIGGASVRSSDHSAASSASGAFVLPVSGAGTTQVSVLALGYYKREFSVTTGRSGLVVSLLPQDPPFDLNFYRQFVRNAHDSPESLSPVKRWTRAPSFYIRTTVQETGETVPDAVVQRVGAILANSVPELSGGQFAAAAVERGPDDRPGADGWVNVTFWKDLGGTVTGAATVGGNSGLMELRYDPDAPSVRPDDPRGCDDRVFYVAEHEVTHTMGLSHTNDEPDDFHALPTAGCNGAPRADRVRYHAAVAYTRAPGNTDVDVDPPGAFGLTAPEVAPSPMLVRCTVVGWDPARYERR